MGKSVPGSQIYDELLNILGNRRRDLHGTGLSPKISSLRIICPSNRRVSPPLSLNKIQSSLELGRSRCRRERGSESCYITNAPKQTNELSLRGIRNWLTTWSCLVNPWSSRFWDVIDEIIDSVVCTCDDDFLCRFTTDFYGFESGCRCGVYSDRGKDKTEF